MSHLRDALLEYPTPRFFTWLLMTSSTMWEVLSSNSSEVTSPSCPNSPEKSKARTSYGMEGLCNRRTSGLALKCAEMCRKQHTNHPKRWIETFGKPAFCLSVTYLNTLCIQERVCTHAWPKHPNQTSCVGGFPYKYPKHQDS